MYQVMLLRKISRYKYLIVIVNKLIFEKNVLFPSKMEEASSDKKLF